MRSRMRRVKFFTRLSLRDGSRIKAMMRSLASPSMRVKVGVASFLVSSKSTRYSSEEMPLNLMSVSALPSGKPCSRYSFSSSTAVPPSPLSNRLAAGFFQ